MKLGIIAAAAVVAAPIIGTAIIPEPASAGCYGTGMYRRCDGYGANKSYSPRGANGRTNYYNGAGGRNYRRETYKTYGSGYGYRSIYGY